MRNSIKVAALGVAGAGVVAGAIAGIRWLRARRANEGVDIDLNDVVDIDAMDFGEPVIVAEEIVVVRDSFDDLEAVPAGGIQK
jgi:hypothetical protein